MAERLTEYYYTDNNKPVYTIRYSNIHNYIEIGDDGVEDLIVQKLGKTEDIMEKYGIESVEELSNALEYAKVIENILSEYGIKDNEELDKKLADGITWKRACELMARVIENIYPEPFYRFTENIPNYFYQQAKKEGNDEQI